MRNFIQYSALLLFAFSCAYFDDKVIRGDGNIKLTRVEYSELDGWNEDDHKAALVSFLNSCAKFNKMKDTDKIGNKIGDIRVADFRDVCRIGNKIKDTSSKQIKNFFENWFVPFEVSDKSGNNVGKFTGYFEPVLEGSFTKSDVYKYPIYGKPAGYYKYSRKEIEEGALYNQNLELIYVKDRVELFFMHIQGTGKVKLDTGEVIKLSYDGKNDCAYKSVGSYLIANDLIDSGDYSYKSMKSWLRVDERGQDVMNINDSYIFFKIAKDDRTIGSQGVPLTAERSLAIDSDILPYGYPIWLQIKAKNGGNFYKKLMVTQDRGSAIKGPVRGDIFFGNGHGVEEIASKMNNQGSYFIFLPANVVSNL